MFSDAQTLKDLEIFESYDGSPGVFSLFDYTKTEGGRACLRDFFLNEIHTPEQLKKRQDAFSFFFKLGADKSPPVHKNQFLFVTQYLRSKLPMIRHNSPAHMAGMGIRLFFRHKGTGLFSNLEFIAEGLNLTLSFIGALGQFVSLAEKEPLPDEIRELIGDITASLSPAKVHIPSRISLLHPFLILKADRWLRTKGQYHIHRLMDAYARVDAYFSVAEAMKSHPMCFPRVEDSSAPFFTAEELYHPFLSHPVPQNIDISQRHFLFLTGPNMAGKTTFLKAMGIAVCLGRAGLPVFAAACRMDFFNGLFTSINTEDNIRKGYSYFFSEVHRVKEAGEYLQAQKKIFFIFDELFKGTNVKDAYDASRLVIKKFAKWRQNLFVLSSHLTELAEEAVTHSAISFYYFESSVVDGRPLFTYKINEGISAERLGLLILQNEGIPDLLEPPGSPKE